MTRLHAEPLRSHMASLERRIRSANLSPAKQLELEIRLLELRERRQFRLALTEDLQGGPDP